MPAAVVLATTATLRLPAAVLTTTLRRAATVVPATAATLRWPATTVIPAMILPPATVPAATAMSIVMMPATAKAEEECRRHLIGWLGVITAAAAVIAPAAIHAAS
ncbi:MAG: hypothetical protein PHU07_05090 [Acidocella sp.]|nr:hypothetical protein [Acidocella sp.]